jgi:hypothetical protein
MVSIPLTYWLLAKVCPSARFSCTPWGLIVIERSTVQEPFAWLWNFPQADRTEVMTVLDRNCGNQ